MKDVLVIQIARFGDLLQTRRLLLSLLPAARVHLLLDNSMIPLASIVYPQLELHGIAVHEQPSYAALSSNRQVFAELGSIGFARVYNCNFSGLTSSVCRLFPDRILTGYRPGHDSQGGLLRSPWARLGFQVSAMRSASPLNLVDFWGWFSESPVAPEKVNPAAKAGGRGIGIAVAGREERRSLPVPVLAEIAKVAFKTLAGPEIRLFGAKSEEGRAKKLMRSFTPEMLRRTIDLCGRTDWRKLVDEMAELDLLLTPDTGLMHLGALLGVPIAAFFLSSAWCHETGPYGCGHMIFQAAPGCAPCLESAACSHNLNCHDSYRSPQFLRTFAQALAGKAVRQPGMQIWRSCLDEFGAKLELLSGEDQYAVERGQARDIIRQCLAPGTAEPEITDPGYLRIFSHFLPDSEWMLPPWRYC